MMGKSNSRCGIDAALFFGGFAAWMAMTSGASPVFAQEETAAVETDAAAAPALLGPDELRKLVAPVAFYPDDLLAIVLPASTSPLQIVQAQRFLDKSKSDQEARARRRVGSLCPGADELPRSYRQDERGPEWTEDLGNAVIDQQSDVMDMIQQLRAEASAAGYLKSDDKQVVVHETETIIIQPADPEVIYVPDYDPQVVYVQSYRLLPAAHLLFHALSLLL